MPVYNGQYASQPPSPNPQALQNLGPSMPVELHVPTRLLQWLEARNKPVPSPLSGVVLIDTGASKSAADITVMQKLQVQPIGQATLGTAGGPRAAPLYPARFVIAPGHPHQITIEFGSVVGVSLAGQTVGQHNVIALIGRDILSRCIFVYNGPQAMFSLAV